MIEDLAALAKELSVEPQLLGAMIHKTPSFYRHFTIPKRTGGVRHVDAPNGHLLKVQRHLVKHLFSGGPFHSAAHGYIEGRSIVSNASQHTGNQCLLKIDLKNFFPSIKFKIVKKLVNLFGDFSKSYTPEVGYYITRLCTLYGALPQGAATSPAISNIIMHPLDNRLEAICQNTGLHYTRYADDLCFSGEDISNETVKLIHETIQSTFFTINPKKSKLVRGQNTSKIVTGIAITNNVLRLPKAKRRQLRAELHRFQTDLTKVTDGDMKLQASLLGKFQHWRFVEPDNTFANDAVNYLRSLKNTEILRKVSNKELTRNIVIPLLDKNESNILPPTIRPELVRGLDGELRMVKHWSFVERVRLLSLLYGNEITPPIPTPKENPIPTPKEKKWSYDSKAKLLKNNRTGEVYLPNQYEYQRSEYTSGYQILHGRDDVWVNDRDIDSK